jgi:hypothetical protein
MRMYEYFFGSLGSGTVRRMCNESFGNPGVLQLAAVLQIINQNLSCLTAS